MAALLSILPTALASTPADFELRHANGGRAWGQVEVRCPGAGVAMLGPGPFEFQVHGTTARIEIERTWVNRTWTREPRDEVILSAGRTVIVENRRLGDGVLSVGSDAHVYLKPSESPGGHSVQANASAVAFGPASSSSDLESFWMVSPDLVTQYHFGFTDVGAWVTTDVPATARGDLQFLMTGGRLGTGDWSLELPAYVQESITDLGVARVTRGVYTKTTVEVRDGSSSLPVGARPFCSTLDTSVDGGWLAHTATGAARLESRRVPIERQEVLLEGRLHVVTDVERAEGDGAPMAFTRGTGAIARGSLDFTTPLVPPSSLLAIEPVAAVIGLASIVYALFKVVPILFTRLTRERLLTREPRRVAHDAVCANPGVTLGRLSALTGMNESNLRYHLAVLRAHKLVRAFKLRGEWRYVNAHSDLQQVVGEAVRATDPEVTALVDWLQGREAAAATMVRRLQAERGLSRTGSWKAIHRACQFNLVSRERRGREVVLRSHGSPLAQ